MFGRRKRGVDVYRTRITKLLLFLFVYFTTVLGRIVFA